MNTQQKSNEEIDIKSYMNNNPILIAADWFWTKVCSPIVELSDRVSAYFTRNWSEKTIAEMKGSEEASSKQAHEECCRSHL